MYCLYLFCLFGCDCDYTLISYFDGYYKVHNEHNDLVMREMLIYDIAIHVDIMF